MKFTPISIALAFALGAPQLSAQEIESFQVTGSRLNAESVIGEAVINRAQIDALNPASTTDLIAAIPHVLLSENGKAGGQSFVTIRGGESNFTLIMIDGVAVNDPTNSRGGGFDFNLLSPDAIERVEVYKGGVSAIYGGEALSGVIHIITRDTTGITARIEAGDENQRNGSLTLSGDISDSFSGLLSVTSRNHDVSDVQNYENNQVWAKLSSNTDAAQHSLTVSYSDQDSAAFAEDSGGELFALPAVAEKKTSEQWLVALNGAYELAETLNLNAQISWHRHESGSINPGIAPGAFNGVPPSEIDTAYKKQEAEVYVSWAANQTLELVAGIEGFKATGSNDGFLDFGFPLPAGFTLEQESYGAFAEGSADFDALTVNVGLRFDDAKGFSSETSLRTHLRYAVSEKTEVFGGYNEGYKLPSFFALAHPLIGNPNLKPERADSYEVGVRTAFTKVQNLEFTVYRNEFSDLVDFDPETFSSVNRSEVLAEGVELLTQVSLTSWLTMQLDVNYQDTEIKGVDAELRRRPEWFGGATLQADFKPVDVTLRIESRDSFTDSSIPTGVVTLGGYTTANLSAQWQVSENLDLTFNVENLLEKSYQQSTGFVIDDANVRAGLVYKL